MKTMLLIDADNVSIDVIEQAVAKLLADHGALHVRRAYCTAESAVKHQAVFKRLGIRPIVNLAAGKNSTDIAMAVDAIDLVLAERPEVVAIASSDSDFAPLVARLREKGCRVIGLGQAGKTGDETQAVYDTYTVLEHHGKPRSTARTAGRTKAAPAARVAPAPSPAPQLAPSPAPKAAAKPARKTTRRKTAAAPAAQAPTPAPSAEAPPQAVQAILAALPELAQGDAVQLRLAAQRLREAGLLSKSGVSTRVFGAHPTHFELLPEKNPNKVRLKA